MVTNPNIIFWWNPRVYIIISISTLWNYICQLLVFIISMFTYINVSILTSFLTIKYFSILPWYQMKERCWIVFSSLNWQGVHFLSIYSSFSSSSKSMSTSALFSFDKQGLGFLREAVSIITKPASSEGRSHAYVANCNGASATLTSMFFIPLFSRLSSPISLM